VRFRFQGREERGEVERAGFHDIGAKVGVQEMEMLFLQLADVPTEALRVGLDAVRDFFEGNK
jgi:hypothetical protein